MLGRSRSAALVFSEPASAPRSCDLDASSFPCDEDDCPSSVFKNTVFVREPLHIFVWDDACASSPDNHDSQPAVENRVLLPGTPCGFVHDPPFRLLRTVPTNRNRLRFEDPDQRSSLVIFRRAPRGGIYHHQIFCQAVFARRAIFFLKIFSRSRDLTPRAHSRPKMLGVMKVKLHRASKISVFRQS